MNKYTQYLPAIVLLAMLAMILLRYLGVPLPVTTPEPIALAYLCGCYWLTK